MVGLFYAEGDEAVVGVIGEGVENHTDDHDDILSCVLHREPGYFSHILHAATLEEYQTDETLQHPAEEKSSDEESGFAPEVASRFEHPPPVPHEAIDNAQHVACRVAQAVWQAQECVHDVEGGKRDESVARAYHSVLKELNYSSCRGLSYHKNSY